MRMNVHTSLTLAEKVHLNQNAATSVPEAADGQSPSDRSKPVCLHQRARGRYKLNGMVEDAGHDVGHVQWRSPVFSSYFFNVCL